VNERRRRRFWSFWFPIWLVVLSLFGLAIASIFIINAQGFTNGVGTLTLLSIVVGTVVSLLSLMVNVFQWRETAETNSMIDTASAPEQLHLAQPHLPSITGTVVTGHLATGPLPPAALLPLTAQDGNPPYIDWGGAPAVEHFYGREQELASLKRWVQEEHCRLIVIQAMGGMGKTTLSKELTQQVSGSFDFIFWRSLQNAPPTDYILEVCVAFFSQQQTVLLPQHLDEQILVLVGYLRKQRCLLVLDNFESVLQGGDRAGAYRAGYEGYGRLLELVGAGQHQSCVLLTTREKPRELARLEGNPQAIRLLDLKGLELKEVQGMLRGFDLTGSNDVWTRFINLYSKNPLALRLASQLVREIFQGDLTTFLKQDALLVGDVVQLIEQQFERASPLEQEILYWLAIEREKTSVEILEADVVHNVLRSELLDSLISLRRRSLVEREGTGLFLLQPVILEYVTGRLITRLRQELSSENLELLQRHALMKAQASDYVRASQIRFLLEPLTGYLRTTLGQEESEQKLKRIILSLQNTAAHRPGYAAGNLLNLLVALGVDLKGYDFSHLVIKQAYLQDAKLADVNFASANLETSTFLETFGNILSLATNPNRQLLAAGTANGKIELWRMPDYTPFLTFDVPGLEEWVRSIAFNLQGDLLASGNDDATVRLWNLDSGRELKLPIKHTGRVYSVAFSSRDDLLASAGDDSTIHIWNVRSLQHIQRLQCGQGRIRSIAFSLQGDLLASGSEDNSISIWDIKTNECMHTLREHSDHVYAVAFSPDGKRLVSGSSDSTVRLWNVQSGNCLHVLQGHSGKVQSVAYSPDGRMLASGSADHTVRLWDSESGRCVHSLNEHSNRIRAVAFTPDSKLVVSGGDDQTVRLWEVDTGQPLKTLHGYSSWVYAVVFSLDGRTVVNDSNDFALHEWDVATGKPLRTFKGHQNWISSIAFSPDGTLLASGGDDQEIRLWNVKSGRDVKVLQAGERVRSVAFSPDSRLLASGSDAKDVLLWDSASGERLTALQGNQDRVRVVTFARNVVDGTDDRILASGGEDEIIRIWHINKTAQEARLIRALDSHSHRIWALAFSPLDNNLLASGGDDSHIRLWNLQAETSPVILQAHTGRIYSLAFRPDGTLLASGSEDHTVRLWNVKTQECVAVLRGHTTRIRSVAFNNDGTLLASGSHDGTVRLWDVQSHECIRVLRTDRPYERMNITDIRGITGAQKNMLKDLGAVEL